MTTADQTSRDYPSEIEELRARLAEAEDTLRAIQSGEVDALVLSGPEGHQVFTLKGEERTYRVLVESMNEGALILTPDGTVIYANSALSRMLGMPLEKIMGSPVHDFVAERDLEALKGLLQSGAGWTSRGELRLRKSRSGEQLSAYVSFSPMVIDDAMAISVVVTDLTEHKRVEAELAQYREHLEELVQQRTEQLAVINEELECTIEELNVATDESQNANRQLVAEIEERTQTQEALVLQTEILRGIGRILGATLQSNTEEELGAVCLEVAEQVTRSPFGFVGEINENGLEDIAVSNPGWDACRIALPGGHRRPPGNFKIHGLYGRVLRDGRPLLTNDPASHPDRVGLPPGHPPLRSFLGVPLIHDGRTIGILAVANGEGGYTEADQSALESLAPAVVEAFLRKRAEEALRESESIYRELVQNANSAILRWRSDGTITFFNEYAQQLFGYSLEEVIGRNVSILVPETESTGADLTTLVAEVLHHPDMYETNVNENILRDGTRIWMTWTNKPIRDANGQVVEVLAVGNDITERKWAEEALRESEERLRLFIESAPVAIAMFDQEIRYLSVSRRWMLDYDLGDRDIIGLSHYEIFPEITDAWKDVHRRSLAGETVRAEEDRFVRADGTVQWLQWEVRPWLKFDGTVGGIVMFTEDITERKHVEDALRESEERLSQVLASGKMGAWEWDLRDNASIWNAQEYRLLGLPVGNGRVATDLYFRHVHPEDLPEFRRSLDEAIDTGTDWAYEHRVVRADGETRWLAGAGRVLRESDGSPSRMIGVNYDITERKRMEQALRESEEYFRSVFDSSPDAIVVADDEGRYVSANPGAAELFGVPQDELVGRRISDFMEPGYDIDEVWADFLRRGNSSAQLRLVRADGSVREVESYITANMLPGCHLSILHDITELTEAEREASAARAEAERHAAELESFVSSMGDGVVLFDAEPKVLLTNQATRNLISPPPDVPYDVWIKAYELRTLAGEQVPLEQYPSRLALRGEVTKDARFSMVSPWQESVVSITGSPVWDAQCRVIGGTLAFRDISDQVVFEREREQLLNREHRIAQVLQDAIMPREVPTELLGYSIAARYRSALVEAEIGGDFYDVFDLAYGKFAVLIGDVAGKGLLAAIRVAEARHTIRSYAYTDSRPARILELANEALSRDTGPEEIYMLTALVIVVDTNVGSITYASAGHEPPIICRSNGSCEELQFGGVPLGVIRGVTYPQVSRRVEPGDTLVMMTDGITEARPSGSALFGKQRVFGALGDNWAAPPDVIATALLDAATAFSGGHLQDDAAIVILRRNADG